MSIPEAEPEQVAHDAEFYVSLVACHLRMTLEHRAEWVAFVVGKERRGDARGCASFGIITNSW